MMEIFQVVVVFCIANHLNQEEWKDLLMIALKPAIAGEILQGSAGFLPTIILAILI